MARLCSALNSTWNITWCFKHYWMSFIKILKKEWYMVISEDKAVRIESYFYEEYRFLKVLLFSYKISISSVI